jgi:hypothetical protein
MSERARRAAAILSCLSFLAGCADKTPAGVCGVLARKVAVKDYATDDCLADLGAEQKADPTRYEARAACITDPKSAGADSCVVDLVAKRTAERRKKASAGDVVKQQELAELLKQLEPQDARVTALQHEADFAKTDVDRNIANEKLAGAQTQRNRTVAKIDALRAAADGGL